MFPTRYAIPLAASAVLLLGACDKLRDAAQPRAQVPMARRELSPAEAEKLASQLCSAANTYERLKIAAFRQAARVRGTDSAPFDRLAAFATIRMEEPLVVSGEGAPRLIRCSGRMAIDLPPGTAAMNGARSLASDVAFAGQPAADGTGLVWTLSAAEPIVYPLATIRRVTGEEFLTPPAVPAIFATAEQPAPAAAPKLAPAPAPEVEPPVTQGRAAPAAEPTEKPSPPVVAKPKPTKHAASHPAARRAPSAKVKLAPKPVRLRKKAVKPPPLLVRAPKRHATPARPPHRPPVRRAPPHHTADRYYPYRPPGR